MSIAFVVEREEERGGWVDNLRLVLSEVPLVHFWVALLLQCSGGCNQFDPTHTSVHLNAPMCQLPWVGGWMGGRGGFDNPLPPPLVHQVGLAAI